MSRLAISLFVCAACAAPQETHRTGPAGAGSGAAPAAAASSTTKQEGEPICTEVMVTGSNIPRTVCRSQEQIDRERDSARQLHERSSVTPGPPARD